VRCSACGGTKYLRPYSPFHNIPICRPCFVVWYDGPSTVVSTDPLSVGMASLKLKAACKWPWDDKTLQHWEKVTHE
jgi:hypothetical protein